MSSKQVLALALILFSAYAGARDTSSDFVQTLDASKYETVPSTNFLILHFEMRHSRRHPTLQLNRILNVLKDPVTHETVGYELAGPLPGYGRVVDKDTIKLWRGEIVSEDRTEDIMLDNKSAKFVEASPGTLEALKDEAVKTKDYRRLTWFIKKLQNNDFYFQTTLGQTGASELATQLEGPPAADPVVQLLRNPPGSEKAAALKARMYTEEFGASAVREIGKLK
jgi:hypothetical protein